MSAKRWLQRTGKTDGTQAVPEPPPPQKGSISGWWWWRLAKIETTFDSIGNSNTMYSYKLLSVLALSALLSVFTLALSACSMHLRETRASVRWSVWNHRQCVLHHKWSPKAIWRRLCPGNNGWIGDMWLACHKRLVSPTLIFLVYNTGVIESLDKCSAINFFIAEFTLLHRIEVLENKLLKGLCCSGGWSWCKAKDKKGRESDQLSEVMEAIQSVREVLLK